LLLTGDSSSTTVVGLHQRLLSRVKRRWQFHNGKFTAGSNCGAGIASLRFIRAANTKPRSTGSEKEPPSDHAWLSFPAHVSVKANK
jgi:hypothetical protein